MSQHVAGAGSRSLVYETGGHASGWRRRIALAIIATVLAFAGHAVAASAATQVVAPDAGEQTLMQGFVDGSLVPTAPGAVTVTGSACPGGQAMACSTYSPVQSTINFPTVGYLFAAPYAADTLDQARVRLEFLHEMGHVFDWTQSSRTDAAHSGALRNGFLKIMHITGSGPSDVRWASGRVGNMMIDPQEQFAMGYSYCAAYPTLPSAVIKTVFWGYGYSPTASQYTQVCSLIDRAGSGHLAARASAARAHTTSHAATARHAA